MAEAHNMSDDEFLAAGDEILEVEESSEADETEIEDEVQDEENEEVLEDTEDDEDSEEVDDTTDQNDDSDTDTDETNDDETDDESQSDDTDKDDDEDSNTDTDEDTQETDDTDYKAFFEEVTQDYKANGKTMPGIKNPKDFITALQQASNYALKTTAIKPHMARIKMLKDVTDAELNEMMDFRNRDPELIKKALVDAKLDPMEIDLDAKSEYAAKDHTVTQAEVEFDDMVDSIKGNATYGKTSDVVTKGWDEKSRQAMLNEPRLIAALNEEMEMGRYDTIQGMIDQNRLLGKNKEMSDLEMYQEIATTMNAEEDKQEQVAEVKPKSKVEDPAKVAERKAEKQKAGIVSKKKPKRTAKKYDPAKLSDDEFEKLMSDGAKFL